MSEIKRNGHGAMDMTQGSPTRLIVLFSLPLLAGNVLQQLYNMVDSVVVGNYVGSSALTAVGAGFSIMFLISSLFLGFSMGHHLQRPAGDHCAPDPAGRAGQRAAAHPDPGAAGGL